MSLEGCNELENIYLLVDVLKTQSEGGFICTHILHNKYSSEEGNM